VGSEAARSDNRIFANLRKIVILRTPAGHQVAFIAIGATCVGSVVINSNIIPGASVARGMEIGYMQFGGSTVILLFEPNAVTFKTALVELSKYPIESFVHINYAIGNVTAG
jgi:phosphatidylserine decarboxylase